MPWFKVDDGFWSHPKVVELTDSAVALWVRAGSYAALHLTNGRITGGAVRMLGSSPETASELVEAGLWERVDTKAWQFKDWFDYQPTAEEVADRKKKRSDAGRKGAAARWNGKRDGNAMANAMANGSQTDAPSPSPSPDSSKTLLSQSSNERARASTDSVEASEWTKRLAGQQGITSLSAVIAAVRKHTAREVGPDAALQISLHLLGKAKNPQAPQRYVTGSIARSPLEVQKFIDDNALGVA